MLYRRIENDIEKWIDYGNEALLVCGVRQAGKTFIVRKCLEDSNCDYVEFNLIDQPEVAQILNNAIDTNDLILKLSLYSKKELVPGKTFIFFDEIQKCKDIVTKIKFLVDDRRFRYVMSGSLLGVEIANLQSAPVGYLQTLELYPLDFEEFIQVFHADKTLLNNLHEKFLAKNQVDEDLHSKLMDIYRLYLIIGGMPAAVESYRKSSNIDEVIRIHQDIIRQYKLDFTQYEQDNRKLLITRIYEMIPAELNKQNKRFKIADIQKNLRYNRIEESFTWLWKAGVALATFNVTEPRIPLLLNEKSTLFKLFLSDVGMLTTMYGKACKLKIVQNQQNINKGAIFENYVAQELSSHGFPLFYYNSKKKGEIDFVIEHNGMVLPIEVKSGKDYNRHSALENVMSTKEYDIRDSIVLYGGNIKVSKGVTYLPIYMTMFIKESDVGFCDISINNYSI